MKGIWLNKRRRIWMPVRWLWVVPASNWALFFLLAGKLTNPLPSLSILLIITAVVLWAYCFSEECPGEAKFLVSVGKSSMCHYIVTAANRQEAAKKAIRYADDDFTILREATPSEVRVYTELT